MAHPGLLCVCSRPILITHRTNVSPCALQPRWSGEVNIQGRRTEPVGAIESHVQIPEVTEQVVWGDPNCLTPTSLNSLSFTLAPQSIMIHVLWGQVQGSTWLLLVQVLCFSNTCQPSSAHKALAATGAMCQSGSAGPLWCSEPWQQARAKEPSWHHAAFFFFLQKFLGTFTIPPILLWQYYSSSLLFLVLFSKSIIILLPSLLSIVPYSVITKLAIVALKFILVFKLQERTLAIFHCQEHILSKTLNVIL